MTPVPPMLALRRPVGRGRRREELCRASRTTAPRIRRRRRPLRSASSRSGRARSWAAPAPTRAAPDASGPWRVRRSAAQDRHRADDDGADAEHERPAAGHALSRGTCARRRAGSRCPARGSGEAARGLRLGRGARAASSASARSVAATTAVRSASCCACSASSWLPAWAACSAPVAPWLAPTSADISVAVRSRDCRRRRPAPRSASCEAGDGVLPARLGHWRPALVEVADAGGIAVALAERADRSAATS